MKTVVGPNSGVFTATVDGQSVDVDTHLAAPNHNGTSNPTGGSVNTADCAITWSQWGLSNSRHKVTITFRGASTDQGSDVNAQASFGFAGFV